MRCGRFLLYGCGAFLHHIIKLTFLLLLSAAVFLLVKNTAVYPFKNKRLYLGLFCLAGFFFAFLCGRLALAFGFVLDRRKMQIVRILLKFPEFRNAERIVKNALFYSHKALIPLRKITLCKIDVYTLRHICVQLFGHILKPSYFIRCSRRYRRAHLKAGAAARLSLTAIVIVVILVTNKILSAAFAVLKNSPAFKQKVYFQIYYRLEAVRNVHLLRQRTHRCYYRVQHRIRFFGNIILYLSKDVHRLAVRMQSGKRSVLALIFDLGKCRSGYRL